MLKWEYRNPEEVAIRREEERLAAEAKKKRKISSVEANEMLKNETRIDTTSHPRRPILGLAAGRKLHGPIPDLPDEDREVD
jgi:hypothetical protein